MVVLKQKIAINIKLNFKIMKHIKQIFFLGYFLLSTLSCKAQLIENNNTNNTTPQELIIPVDDDIIYRKNQTYVPDGSKVKDVNNLLDEYVGTWIGNHNGMTIELRIEEYTWVSDDPQTQIIENDELILRYKLTDSNGTVIEDTTNQPDDGNLVVHGDYLSETGSHYAFSFYTKAERCEPSGKLYVSVGWDNNPNKMKASLNTAFSNEFMSEDPNCPNGYVQPFIPRSPQMTLMKQ